MFHEFGLLGLEVHSI